MRKNIEKDPKSPSPEQVVEEEAMGAEKILRDVLGEIESQEETMPIEEEVSIESPKEMRRIEDEAYKEKEERERYEEARQREQEDYERTMKRSYNEGAATYMAFETAEKISDLSREKHLDHEAKQQAIQDSFEYLKLLGYEREYDFGRDVDDALFSARGTYLRFGSFTHTVKKGFNREGYLEAMGELSQIQDRLWEGKEEELKTDEILALREKKDRQALTKHLEGFGTTALEHGDIKTAVDAFIQGGLLQDENLAKRVAEKMRELAQSSEVEDRAKAIAAKESLKNFFEGSSEEEGK